MTPAPRKINQLRLIWAGLAVLLAAFAVSMGGLNAWQLEHQGVPVHGEWLGSEVVRVLDCRRDPSTLFQSFNCTVEWQPGRSRTVTELRSLTELSGELLVDVYPGQQEPVLVAPGMQAAWVAWSPTDLALVAWLVVIVLAPMVVAVINGVRHTADFRHGPGSPFDALASSWDADPAKLGQAEAVAAAIRDRVPAGGAWLDFGSGTGLLGISLLDHAGTMVLADASAGMLAAAAQKVEQLGAGDRVAILELDLAVEDGPADSFDAVVSLLALHHLPDLGLAVRRLVALLRPGGYLAVADLDAEDGSFHAQAAVRPAHDGIERDALADWLGAAGLEAIEFSTPTTVHKNDRDYEVFLAVARKPKNLSPEA